MTELEILENELHALMDQMNQMGGENPDYEKVRKNYQELIKTYINLKKIMLDEKNDERDYEERQMKVAFEKEKLNFEREKLNVEIENQFHKDKLENSRLELERERFEDEKNSRVEKKYIYGIPLEKFADYAFVGGLATFALKHEEVNVISTRVFSFLKSIVTLI